MCAEQLRTDFLSLPASRELDALVAEKVCRKCGSKRRMRVHQGRHTQCLDCHNRRTRERNAQDRRGKPRASNQTEKFRTYRKKWALRKRYGITPEQYDALLKKQHGHCAICREKPNGRPLCVDHCHQTGVVRGLLCDSCNIALAQFKDNPRRLAEAIAYMGLFSSALQEAIK